VTRTGKPPVLDPSRVSIRDVAAAAGVSLTTVSHALNDVEGARVALKTRERVRKTARELGYSPSRSARSLRLQRTHTLAMVSDVVATSPHAGEIILGAQETAFARGWALAIFNIGQIRDLESRDLDPVFQHEVDGVIYATMYHRHVKVPARMRKLPLVLLDARCDNTRTPSVVPDEVLGGRTATEELIKRGHRCIGFATNRDDIPATWGRLEGYKAALKAAGIRFDRKLVVAQESEASGGYAAARRLLSLQPRPTAIFCFNDRMAMGAYRAVAEARLSIPDDVSIIGFDNQEIIAEGLHPSLTTVALPHFEMGRWAVENLIDLIEDPSRVRPTVYPTLMPCPLVSRESVGSPRAA
jgi:LacI family transcriptional regulator